MHFRGSRRLPTLQYMGPILRTAAIYNGSFGFWLGMGGTALIPRAIAGILDRLKPIWLKWDAAGTRCEKGMAPNSTEIYSLWSA